MREEGKKYDSSDSGGDSGSDGSNDGEFHDGNGEVIKGIEQCWWYCRMLLLFRSWSTECTYDCMNGGGKEEREREMRAWDRPDESEDRRDMKWGMKEEQEVKEEKKIRGGGGYVQLGKLYEGIKSPLLDFPA